MITQHLNLFRNLYPKAVRLVLNKSLKFSSNAVPKIVRVSKKEFEELQKFNPVRQSTKKILPFDEFKTKNVESFDQFKKAVGSLSDNEKELYTAYESFCNSQYALYKKIQLGGNPGLVF